MFLVLDVNNLPAEKIFLFVMEEEVKIKWNWMSKMKEETKCQVMII